jgi:adenylate cyclase, class 2
MKVEVEQKFRIDDPDELIEACRRRGAEFGPPKTQIDTYYAHPQRDFASTDEALRIRRVEDASYVTYKGPKLDRTTKTRHEIEVALAGANEADDMAMLLEALGFRPVANVRKRRRKLSLAWQGCDVEISLDDVEGVGTFAELEVVTDEAQRPRATECLRSLAAELGLRADERRSYLELLLAGRHAAS